MIVETFARGELDILSRFLDGAVSGTVAAEQPELYAVLVKLRDHLERVDSESRAERLPDVKIACPNCDGTGDDRVIGSCHRCDGTGKVPAPDKQICNSGLNWGCPIANHPCNERHYTDGSPAPRKESP